MPGVGVKAGHGQPIRKQQSVAPPVAAIGLIDSIKGAALAVRGFISNIGNNIIGLFKNFKI